MDNQLRIYAFDLETRLTIDSLDFDNRKEDLHHLEREAFLLFKKLLEEQLEDLQIDEKDFSISMEHHLFNKYIKALVNIIEAMERELHSSHFLLDERTDFDQIKLHATTLRMACHYRYPFGLYDDHASLEDYIGIKVKEFPKFKYYFRTPFQLETLNKDAVEQYKHSRQPGSLKEYFGKEVEYRWGENDTEFGAYFSIQEKLAAISLATNYDWNFSQDREFSYWEEKVIIADLLSYLRNELRKAFLDNFEPNIEKYVYSINLVSNYLIGFHGGTSVPAEEISKELFLKTNYLNIGILGASIYETSLAYADDVRILGSRGHGVAAERANHMIDRMKGQNSELLGDDNEKNGADRLVGNDFIQSKYCSTGGKCISECFEEGKFRYVAEGKPMTIEVPKDKYEDAIKSLQDRIRRGDMKDLGITDPEAAKDIVKKGNISYKTAQRIAKAGTIEGVIYDAGSGMIQATQAFGISMTISFAQSLWHGEEMEDAISNALETGTKVFGVSIVSHIATKQIGRTMVEKSMRPMTDYVAKEMLGSKTSAKIVNTFLRKSSEKAVHGAAATNQLSKVLRGNVVTMAVTTAVMSSGHIYDAIEGRISGKQLLKNISTVGAGVGGAAIGATVGSVVPVVGTFVGGLVGGWVGGKVSKKAMDHLIEDDSVATFEKLKDVFVSSIAELELDREELNFIMEYVFDQKKLPKTLKLIYAANDKTEYIEDMIDPYIEATLKARPKVMEAV